MSITKSFYKRRLSMTQYDTQTSANKTKVSKTPKLLKSLRSRKSLNNTILPEDAAEVVKNYLIPMFDRKIRSKTKKQKTELTNQSFDITNSKGIITEELVLSSKLYEKLKVTQENNEILVKQNKEFQQIKEIKDSKEKNYQRMYLNSEANLQAVLMQVQEYSQEVRNYNQKNLFFISEKETYKKMYEKSTHEIALLTESLNFEQKKNDIR